MPLITIHLSDELMHEVISRSHTLRISQTEYIRKAVERMNEEVAKQERKQKLIKASLRVRNESMSVNAEFSRIEHDPEAPIDFKSRSQRT